MVGENVLAIDVGTQSVRALVFDLRGNLLAKSKVAIEYDTSVPGITELDPEKFWEVLCQACQILWTQEQVDRQSIAGITLTTQSSGLVNLDANGKPLRPAIIWMDQRRTPGLKPVSGLWGLGFWLTGMTETVAKLQTEAEANWIRTYQPEIWQKTAHYLFLSGYLTYRMTGLYRDSVGSQVGYVPFDYKKLEWAAPSDWKWQAVPMERAILPELISPTGCLGEITKAASAATGIPQGLKLIASAADKACEVIGAGCIDPAIACISYGTQATLNTTSKRYIELIPLIPPFPSAMEGAYNLSVEINRGYWMVSWFKREFAQNEQRLARDRGVDAESLFDDLVYDAPPGSSGLMLQPYWSPGIKIPGPEAKGAIIGFGDVHTRSHLYRSILEGLAYALREGAENMQKKSGVAFKEIRIAGGGSQSKAAMQLTADIFGIPTAKPHIYEASGLGAAIDAALGLGLHPDFSSAILGMTRQERIYEPNLANHHIYNALYERVYRKMYARLKPLYSEIREITGYPPKL